MNWGIVCFCENLHVEKNYVYLSTLCMTFQTPEPSTHNMAICCLSLHQGNTESYKNLEQKFIFAFQLDTLEHPGVSECFSFNLFICSKHAQLTVPLFALRKDLGSKCHLHFLFIVEISLMSTHLIENFSVKLLHWFSSIVSSETYLSFTVR